MKNQDRFKKGGIVPGASLENDIDAIKEIFRNMQRGDNDVEKDECHSTIHSADIADFIIDLMGDNNRSPALAAELVKGGAQVSRILTPEAIRMASRTIPKSAERMITTEEMRQQWEALQREVGSVA